MAKNPEFPLLLAGARVELEHKGAVTTGAFLESGLRIGLSLDEVEKMLPAFSKRMTAIARRIGAVKVNLENAPGHAIFHRPNIYALTEQMIRDYSEDLQRDFPI